VSFFVIWFLIGLIVQAVLPGKYKLLGLFGVVLLAILNKPKDKVIFRAREMTPQIFDAEMTRIKLTGG